MSWPTIVRFRIGKKYGHLRRSFYFWCKYSKFEVLIITIASQSYVQTLVNFKSFKVFKAFKGYNMFQEMWPSSGVTIYI
jgi:hypothetical protein